MYRLDRNLSSAGTSMVSEIDLAPHFLVARFGPAMRGTDDNKVTGQYRFVARDGSRFTIYDYKSTSAYLGDVAGARTPEEFWASDEEHSFSVGGEGEYDDGSADAFVGWVQSSYLAWLDQKR